MSVYKAASLFAEISGICPRFRQAGFDIVRANEIDDVVCRTYRHNFDNYYLVKGIYRNICCLQKAFIGLKLKGKRIIMINCNNADFDTAIKSIDKAISLDDVYVIITKSGDTHPVTKAGNSYSHVSNVSDLVEFLESDPPYDLENGGFYRIEQKISDNESIIIIESSFNDLHITDNAVNRYVK